jgi:UDP-N-acetylglucosamine diphosphorylase / glucose-1-phosphate thymidylyltransferase / UDP-N-acetylgalactosamine diphosphorylase / glucosamine-1-phosphate N-acetyltransferase / galactosamine-1-phosphate N-acetyltransferase
MDLTLVVPAAGKGSRLAQSTAGKPKVMMNVAGKPVLQFVLDAGLQAPLSRIVIIVGSDGTDIKDFFGTSYRGIAIHYVTQSAALGLAHAVSLAESCVPDTMLVINGDEIFLDSRHLEMFRFMTEKDADGVVGFLETSESERILMGYGLDLGPDGRVEKLVEKPNAAWNNILGVGTWLVRRDFFDSYKCTPISEARRERDLVSVIQLMVDRGRRIYGFNLMGTFINLNRPQDLLRAEAALGSRAKAADAS